MIAIKPPAGDAARPVKHSILVAGHRTSISLEPVFWQLLRRAAGEQGRSANDLVTDIDRTRQGNLSSAIRVYLVTLFLDAAD